MKKYIYTAVAAVSGTVGVVFGFLAGKEFKKGSCTCESECENAEDCTDGAEESAE